MFRKMFTTQSDRSEFAATVANDQRRTQRHPAESITCALGDVVDLSRAGMRLTCKGKPPVQVSGEAQLRLVFPRGSILVLGQVRWIKRRGIRNYDVGFQFINLSEAAANALDSLARFGFVPKETAGEAAERNKKRSVRASIDLPDYYAMLGVQPGASQEEIQKAYRQMARQYHPDLNRNDEAEQQFMRLREAYDVLMDMEQRQSYDNRTAG